MEYKLQLTEEKVKRHQVTALHLLCALAFIGAGAIIYVYNTQIPYCGLGVLITGISLLLLTIFKNKLVTGMQTNSIFRVVELVIALGICGYTAFNRWGLPAAMFGILSAGVAFAMFWERSAGGGQFIYISEEGIKLPVDSRKRFLEWTVVNEVILKFGTLSFDCTDNRLFQWNVHEPAFDKTTFEAFCATQIADSMAKRKSDDW